MQIEGTVCSISQSNTRMWRHCHSTWNRFNKQKMLSYRPLDLLTSVKILKMPLVERQASKSRLKGKKAGKRKDLLRMPPRLGLLLHWLSVWVKAKGLVMALACRTTSRTSMPSPSISPYSKAINTSLRSWDLQTNSPYSLPQSSCKNTLIQLIFHAD